MRRYIINRLLILIPVILLVTVIVFSLIHCIPGDPVDFIFAAADLSDPTVREDYRKMLGMDKPLPVQYVNWMGKVVTGDFGESIFFRRKNIDLVMERFPASLLLTIVSMIVSIVIAIPAGIISAIRRNTISDYASMIVALLGISMPNFWLGIILILIFGLYIPILPSSGYVSPLVSPWAALKHLILPSVTLGLGMAAIVARMTRSEMLEVIGKEYVRTARAKGMSERRIIFKHALKNALIPTITVIGIQFGRLLGGSVVVEYVFAWPGIGTLMVDAVFSRDYPLIQILILIFAGVFIFVNFFVDIIYKYLNPRITLD